MGVRLVAWEKGQKHLITTLPILASEHEEMSRGLGQTGLLRNPSFSGHVNRGFPLVKRKVRKLPLERYICQRMHLVLFCFCLC